MPELNFRIAGVDTAARGLTPLFLFKLEIDVTPATDRVLGLLLNVQVQLQCPQRAYSPAEQARLYELFGLPEQWGHSLRNRLWTHTHTTVGAFAARTETVLPVACTFDLNIATAKYFYALESGEVPLLFLFSGSVFYLGPGERLQVEPVSWSKECEYRLPVQAWRELMERHYPNTAWLTLRRELFEQLCAYKRRQRVATWDEAIAQLLADQGPAEHRPPETPENRARLAEVPA